MLSQNIFFLHTGVSNRETTVERSHQTLNRSATSLYLGPYSIQNVTSPDTKNKLVQSIHDQDKLYQSHSLWKQVIFYYIATTRKNIEPKATKSLKTFTILLTNWERVILHLPETSHDQDRSQSQGKHSRVPGKNHHLSTLLTILCTY